MKCGHLICPECLEGRVRKPYCDFCGEPLEGPFVTPEMLSKIEDKYKKDQEEGTDNYFEEESSDEESSDEEYEYYSESDEDQKVMEEQNETGE